MTTATQIHSWAVQHRDLRKRIYKAYEANDIVSYNEAQAEMKELLQKAGEAMLTGNVETVEALEGIVPCRY